MSGLFFSVSADPVFVSQIHRGEQDRRDQQTRLQRTSRRHTPVSRIYQVFCRGFTPMLLQSFYTALWIIYSDVRQQLSLYRCVYKAVDVCNTVQI